MSSRRLGRVLVTGVLLASVAAVPTGVSVDLVHPTAVGYQAIGATVAVAVGQLVDAS